VPFSIEGVPLGSVAGTHPVGFRCPDLKKPSVRGRWIAKNGCLLLRSSSFGGHCRLDWLRLGTSPSGLSPSCAACPFSACGLAPSNHRVGSNPTWRRCPDIKKPSVRGRWIAKNGCPGWIGCGSVPHLPGCRPPARHAPSPLAGSLRRTTALVQIQHGVVVRI
jgi:hypothetical protein